MADIAQLGYQVDSSQLTKGTAALDKHTAAAGRTETATAKFERETQKLARSQKELAMANRQLPMQFTDIAVSLQAGMSPMQVLLQQGTQIKDMYGGVGSALRASAGYIAGLINPATLAAGAIVGLAVAYSQLEERQNAIDRSLIRTGRYSEDFAEQLSDLAGEMDEISGVTAGSAAKAIAEVASVGSFTAEQLQIAARAAETWRVASGVAVEDTVKEFEKIRKDPVDALLALNRQYNFLTEAQLDQIDTLKEQGKEQEAATEAFRIYADVLESRAPQMEAQVGSISAALRGLGRAGREAWDTVVQSSEMGFDHMVGFASRYGGIVARIAGLTAMGLGGTNRGGGPDFSNVSTAPIIDSDAIERERKAQEQWDRMALSNLSKQEKLEREIADIRKTGTAAKKTEAEIERQIAQARARYAESLPKGRKPRAEQTDPTDALIKRLQDQIALNEAQIAQEDKLTTTERMLVQVRTELERIGAKGSATNKTLIAQLMEQAKATDEAAQAAERKAKADEALARLQERTALAEQNQRRANEIDLLGMSGGSEATEMLRRQLDLHRWYEDQVVELRRQAAREKREVTAAEEGELKAALQRMLDEERRYQEERQRLMGDWTVGANRAFQDYIESARDIAGQTNEIFANAFGGLEDLMVDFITTGQGNWRGFFDSLAADITRFVVRQQLSKWMESIMGGMGGGNATAFGANSFGGGGGGWFSSLMGAIFGGGRAYGGDVRSGSYYRVGEGDRPELLNMGRGRQYLIPGDSGRVEPIRGESGAPSITIAPTIMVAGRPDKRTRTHIGRELAEEIRIAQRMS